MRKILEIRFLENDEVDFQAYICQFLDEIDYQIIEKAFEAILMSFSLMVKPTGIEKISVYAKENNQPEVEIIGENPYKELWKLFGYTMFAFIETINYFAFKSVAKDMGGKIE